jgi:hypothetical protein
VNFISAFIGFFSSALRAIISEGWQAMARLLDLLRTLLRRCLYQRDLPHHIKKRDPSRCTPIRRPEFRRPDPMIYAQYYLMNLGLAVTWDNPDITLEKAAGPLEPNAPPDPAQSVSSHQLLPDTEYDVVARVWNGSTDAPVVGLPVRFWFFGFGIGTQPQAIGDATTDLGVKGGPGCPAYARVRWRTPSAGGHYCIQAYLDWFDDLNPANNLGQENTDVGTAQSPAHFTFRLRNAREKRQPFRFDVDAYAIPEPDPCAQVDRVGQREQLRERRRQALESRRPQVAGRPETFVLPDLPARHRGGAHPVPEGWSVEITPPAPILDAGEEIDIAVSIAPPDGFSGRQAINIHAFDTQGLAGGVTLQIEKA